MKNADWKELQDEFLTILLEADTDKGLSFTKDLLDGKALPAELFENCISPVLYEIGRQFETLEIFLPQMVQAAEIVNQINEQLIAPAIKEHAGTGDGQAASISKGKVVIGTIQGDLHDIGKNMVALILQVNGFEVIDMGINVSPTDLVDRAEQEQADIIGMSSLLTTCLPYMKDLVDFLDGKSKRNEYAVIIGGAAPTDDFAESIGVDGHGHSAAEAVTICLDIMNSMDGNP